MDGFVDQSTNAQRGCSDPTNPACAATDTPDVMGYHTRSDIPNYWTLRRQLRAAGPHVRARTRRGACPRTCSRCRSGRRSCTQHDNPSSCTNALQAPGLPPDFGGRRANGSRGRDPDLRVDRPDVSPPPEPGVVGLLRRQRAPSPTARTTPRCRARRCARTPTTPGIWNPLPYFDTVQADGAARQHPVGRQLLHRGQGRDAAGGVVGRAVGRGERAPAGAGQLRADVRDEPRQRGDARPRLEVAPRSSWPGTTGAASTTTS